MRNKEFIYTQYCPADSIYFIFQGECILMQNKNNNTKEIADAFSRDLNYDYKYIMTLGTTKQ